MTDGPYRSLSLKRHWKGFARRADIEVYSLEERRQYLLTAVKKEFSESVLTATRDILNDKGFFHSIDSIKLIEAIRKDCRGSTADNTFLNNIVYELSKGRTGEMALQSALKNAFEEVARAHLRSIEEHYCRKEAGVKTIARLRKRIDETIQKTSFVAMASESTQGFGLKSATQKLSKRTEIDEGPEF